jgi:hypothetical protein
MGQPRQTTSIFAVSCNQTSQRLASNTLFLSREGAREHLKKLAKDRQSNLGVRCWQQDDDSFSFLLGWEEVSVRFSIIDATHSAIIG